jgi:uncharacterized protein (TIGR02598 family)
MAIAVITVAIIGLLNLMAVSLQSSREATDDSLLAAMANQVVAELRAMPFKDLTTETNKTYFFDSEGITCEEDKAIYRCTVRISEPAAEADKTAEKNWKFARLEFRSPPKAANSSTHSLHATISNMR